MNNQQEPIITDEMIAAAETVEDLYRRGTPDTWRKVFLAMWKEMPAQTHKTTKTIAELKEGIFGWAENLGGMDAALTLFAERVLQSQAQQKCSCVRATARNTPAVKAGYEMGGYVKNVCAHCQSKAQQNHSEDALNMVQSQAQQESQWISVEERLPEEGAVVDVNIKSKSNSDFRKRKTSVLFSCGSFQLDYTFDSEYVSHWMPLPPAPMNEVNKPKGVE